MKQITFIAFVLIGFAVSAQQCGGKIKLKFTCEGKPLVGYAITTSINNVEIGGGKGTTDSNGEVQLDTEPLPIGDIDVKGEIDCDNTTKKFEASGFVHVSPSNGNFCELRLERVAKQMAELSGMPIETIMESFGVNCATCASSSGSSTATDNSTSSGNSNVESNTASDQSSGDTEGQDQNEWSKKNEEAAAKREENFVFWDGFGYRLNETIKR